MASKHDPPSGQPRWRKTRAAKLLRRNPTAAETLLWQALRNRQAGGFKFRRQQALGDFVADFFCVEAGLVIELDGGIHEQRQAYDTARSAWLQKEGIAVQRFTNEDVRADLPGVVDKIIAFCRERRDVNR